MNEDLFETVLVPIASPDDAADTASAVHRYVPQNAEILVVHVIEKGEGVPDKASVDQRRRYAEDVYERFLQTFPDRSATISILTLYGRNVAETIVDTAIDADATIIAFTPRGGTQLMKLFTGDRTGKLITNDRIPVIALPKQPERVEG